ncbi:Uncharacterised protein [Blautia hydrogenotrophica]|jgi:hypothetical protein|uniref:hypothetical protein n=1 Tax=Blautia hydrogenotrophica TaxID=53443 RepID=UPI0006BEE6CD|nr:hypothetical protein [Blautia hydrogenotrophica]CUM74288.1 Uncharacterised protein [Blautia hydrogenotrophica]SCH63966.1 Uncharacterised protein [uncultured Blautia sp.]
MIVVVYEEDTKEVIACIDLSGEKPSILKNNVCADVYNGTEPVFLQKDNKVTIGQNKFIINP